jgi:hypothetical protein
MKMSLSDACHDFNSSVKDGVPLVECAAELLDSVEYYGKPDYPIPYWPHQIEALRQAAKAVLADPADFTSARWLMDLAECVRAFHDLAPSEMEILAALKRRRTLEDPEQLR